MVKGIVKALPLLVVVALGSGCANTAKIDEANASAATAQQAANEANQAAAEALSAARAAQATADEALAAANEANTKVDRAFKKAMAK